MNSFLTLLSCRAVIQFDPYHIRNFYYSSSLTIRSTIRRLIKRPAQNVDIEPENNRFDVQIINVNTKSTVQINFTENL